LSLSVGVLILAGITAAVQGAPTDIVILSGASRRFIFPGDRFFSIYGSGRAVEVRCSIARFLSDESLFGAPKDGMSAEPSSS
jgi:hypothetical protein